MHPLIAPDPIVIFSVLWVTGSSLDIYYSVRPTSNVILHSITSKYQVGGALNKINLAWNLLK